MFIPINAHRTSYVYHYPYVVYLIIFSNIRCIKKCLKNRGKIC